MLCLIVRKGKEKERIFPLIQNVVAVGSHRNNDIQLNDSSSTISRFHFALFQDNNGNYVLQDLGSKNGTLVNGKITPHKILMPDDKVVIGKQFSLEIQDVKKARAVPKKLRPIRIVSEEKNITELITSFASPVSSTDVLSKLENSPKKLNLLYKLTRDLLGSETLHDILQGILEGIVEATGAERGFIARGTAIDDLDYLARVPDEITTVRSRTLITQALHVLEPLVIKDAQADSHLKNIRSVSVSGIRSSIGIPLKGDMGIMGLLYLDSMRNPDIFNEEDIIFLSTISNDIALAMAKDEAKEELHHLAASEHTIVGISKVTRKLLQSIENIAPYPSSVLITGDTGAGKELVARAIHKLSTRKGGFVALNCAAIPEGLLESELFGYMKGAFAGAVSNKQGLFELANEGTLFLDEIGDMPLNLQAKLLRVIEGNPFKRLGGVSDIEVDVRIIAATNKNIQDLIDEKRFKEDLYFRINVLSVKIPPLRERQDDIPLLAGYFIYKLRKKLNKDIGGLNREAVELLANYSWPGNIRELANVMENAAIYAKSSYIITPSLLKMRLSDPLENLKSLEEVEKEHIIKVLEYTRGNKDKAARILGINRLTIRSKGKKHKLPGFDSE